MHPDVANLARLRLGKHERRILREAGDTGRRARVLDVSINDNVIVASMSRARRSLLRAGLIETERVAEGRIAVRLTHLGHCVRRVLGGELQSGARIRWTRRLAEVDRLMPVTPRDE